jgi:hypothetical protein
MKLKVGDKRKFSFNDKNYKILEVIDNPNINMEWTWTSGVCSHCRRKLERIVNHKFYNIEILAPEDMEEKNVKNTDIVVMGNTIDRRYMQIPIDNTAYNQSLSLSKKFRKFLLEE